MCKSIFTTQEAAELSSSLVVQYSSQDLRRFSKEQLLMSIYDSCKHRRNAADDATALTQTIVGRLLKAHKAGALKRNDLVTIAHEVLHHFDLAAATFYQAYHPLH